MSQLPGYECDPAYGAFPSARDWATYLDAYAKHHRLDVRFGVEVRRIEMGPLEWVVRTADEELRAPAVVVATGYDHDPKLPPWPGLDSFTAELTHAADYRNAEPYRGRSVLVAGVGNSGSEIAAQLAVGGAAKVWLAMRTPPTLFPRRWLGMPTNPLAVALDVLPTPVADRLGFFGQRLMIGNLSRYGVPRAEYGLKTRLRRDGIAACVDGGFVKALKGGLIEVVPAVSALDGAAVELGVVRVEPDAVIAATGYRRGLEGLVGHLGVLHDDGVPQVHGERTHPNAPGLYFVGFDALNSGQLRLMSRDAEAVARKVAHGRGSWPAFGRASAGRRTFRLPGTPRTRPA
jgi:cation diffusion facilitator CzcD-associated flavoprotein CzcO